MIVAGIGGAIESFAGAGFLRLRTPAAQDAGSLLIHRKETFETKFLQGDVLRRSQRCYRREQSQARVAFAEMHRKPRRRRQLGWRGVEGLPHPLIGYQPL